jgi:hypothetical protein
VLSFAVTILRITSKECLDNTAVTLNNLLIAGVECVSVTHPTSQLKKHSSLSYHSLPHGAEPFLRS